MTKLDRIIDFCATPKSMNDLRVHFGSISTSSMNDLLAQECVVVWVGLNPRYGIGRAQETFNFYQATGKPYEHRPKGSRMGKRH